ncbi:hypothetical protein DPSP01_002429 [Paraphaeosphaeria sporulosa]
MARTFATVLNTIGTNPYPPARDKEPDVFICEICDRRIGSKDWAAHKNSKKHRACEDELGRAKDVVDTKYPATDKKGNDDAFDQGAWNQDDGAPYLRGGDSRTCNGCGEVGHIKRNCPNPPAGGSSGGACYSCGQEGHQKRDCPNGGGDACFNCGMTGHRKVDCTAPPQARQGGGAGQQCFNCHKYGHRKTECPNERVMKCRNCDEIGHMSKECPKPKDWSRVQCDNCKSFGHTVKRCKAPPVEDTNGGSWGDSGADSGAAPVGDWTDASVPAGGDNWGGATVVDGW